MGVFEDMGSLSISPSYGAYTCNKASDQREELHMGFPLMGNCSSSFDDTQNSEGGGNGDGKGSETSDGFRENSGAAMEVIINKMGIDLNEEKQSESSGQSKLCARGHWRPAEDSKLRELVALYGPQNWNLIAEKLEGRSGRQLNSFTHNCLLLKF